MRGKVTKRSVDALRAPASGEVVLWDEELAGFGVRVRTGGAKTYVLRYRPGAGGRKARLRTFTIGRHGSPWAPEEARGEAKRLLGLVRGGEDPAAQKSALRKSATVRELADKFL